MSWKLKKKLKDRLGSETGSVKKDWGGKTSVCLVYPNEYHIGMGNLAVHSIYHLLNERRDIVCERAFLPDRSDVMEYARGRSPVMSMESQRSIAEFDVVAFTTSFENDYLNIIPILTMSQIPNAKDERKNAPILVAGGAAVTLNPKPVSSIFDVVFLGEFEAFSDDFLKISKGGMNVTDRRIANDLDAFSTQTTIYNEEAEFGNMHLIEVSRGCPHRCKFCATPSLYGRYRTRSVESIVRMVDAGLPHRKKFGLIGSDILSHPGFVDIAEYIHEKGGTFSPSSIRADAIDEKKAALLAKSGHRSVALGVEAAGEALRNSIGKRTSDERIMDSVAMLARAGISRVRLYFMIGLPNETDGDAGAIAIFAQDALETLQKNSKKGASASVDVTLSPFIPKPGTPFEKENFAGEETIKSRLKIIKNAFARSGHITVRCDSIKAAVAEAHLSTGEKSILDEKNI